MKYFTGFVLFLTSFCVSASVVAGMAGVPVTPIEPQSCYGYQPMCYGFERSCCICDDRGLNCHWGCCR